MRTRVTHWGGGADGRFRRQLAHQVSAFHTSSSTGRRLADAGAVDRSWVTIRSYASQPLLRPAAPGTDAF